MPSTNVTRGSTNVTCPRKWNFNPATGTTCTQVFMGSESEMTNLYNTYVSAQYQCTLEEGPAWTLTVTNPSTDTTNETPVLNYELLYDKYEKSLGDSDAPLVKGLSVSEKKILKDYLNQPHNYDTASPAFTSTAGLQVLALIKCGVKNDIHFTPVLKVSYTCSNTYAIQRNTANNGLLLTTETLVNQEDVPITLSPLLPNSGVCTYVSSDHPPVSFAWLQYPPTVTSSAWNRLQVSQEYHFGLWSTELYGNLV